MISPDETLGHLATTHPEATAVFFRHRLDFCCGGGRKLTDACKSAGLDPTNILAEIAAEAIPKQPQRWDTRSIPELIDFIVNRYHAALRQELPALIHAAKKVERVHAAKPTVPHGLAAHLETFAEEILQHLAKEENMLFPALRSGSHGQQVHMPIRMMMHEHNDHAAILTRTRELTTNFVPPVEACATWRAMYAALATLEEDLMEHIHLENNVLFPRGLQDEVRTA